MRTFCGEDLIEKAKAEQGDELAGVVKPKLPDDAASPYAPRTTCFWTIKFWRDGDEPQHDGVWIEHVLWRPDVRFPVATSIPETGAVEAIYPAAYGCKPATVFVLVGFGDRFGEHKFRYKKVDGCLPCPPTDD